MTGKRSALSFLTCVLAATCLTPHAAFSAQEPQLSFYPAQKWTVTNASKTGDASVKTCTVSNTFNNGFNVEFAGSADGFINLNIDFRQPSFAQNKLYEVQYTIPGVATKIIPTKAFKDTLLVSDLRGEKDFSTALRSAGVVDMKIQNNEFRLYLTGLEAAMKEYTQCITPAGSALQADAAPLPVMPQDKLPESLAKQDLAPPPPMPDPQSLKQAAIQKPVVADQPKPKAALRPDFDRKRYTEELAEQMKSNAQHIVVPVTVEKQAPLAAQNAAQQEPAQGSVLPMPSGADTAQIEPQADAETGTVTNTKIAGVIIKKNDPISGKVDLTKIAEMPPIEEAPPVAAIAANEIADPNARLLSQIEPSAGAASPTPMPETHAPAQAAVNTQAMNDLVDMRSKVVDLEQQLISLQKENAMLDTELKATLQDTADERTSISSNNWDLERATMRYNEAELQIARLGRQLQSSKSQCDMEKSELKAMLFDPKLTDQNQLAKLSSLEEEVDRAKTDLVVQQRTYEERIRLLEQQLNKQQ